jgi:hypothetical protein
MMTRHARPLAALIAFVAEHRRCGELDGGLEGEVVRLRCTCGAELVRPAGRGADSPG